MALRNPQPGGRKSMSQRAKATPGPRKAAAPKGMAVRPGSSYTGGSGSGSSRKAGTWRDKSGKVYGYSNSEDSPIRRRDYQPTSGGGGYWQKGGRIIGTSKSEDSPVKPLKKPSRARAPKRS